MTSPCPNAKYLNKYLSNTENFVFYCLNSGGGGAGGGGGEGGLGVGDGLVHASVLVVTRDLPGVKVSADLHQKEIHLKEEITNSRVGGWIYFNSYCVRNFMIKSKTIKSRNLQLYFNLPEVQVHVLLVQI